MDRILASTDFSAASRHALDFTANLVQDREVLVDLVHPYPVSLAATADALALAGLGAGIDHAERLMLDELGRIRNEWPRLRISGRVIAGHVLETLREESVRTQPRFIVLGTAGFADLYLGDADPLDALKMLQAPVLFVPQGAALRPIRHVTYACNYRFAGPGRTPANAMQAWIEWTGASFDIVHTDRQQPGEDSRQSEGEGWMRQRFAALNPSTHWIVDGDLLHGLSSYLSESSTDCVMAVPRRYGFWESLFHQSRTKALARLNRLPVIAIHEL